MHPYKKATDEVLTIVHASLPFAKKAALIQGMPGNTFTYLDRKTGCFVIKVPEGLQKKAQTQRLKENLYKQGFLPITDFDDNASEDKGLVLVRRPQLYAPFAQMRKYAAGIDTPAKLSLAGALIAGSLTGGWSLWNSLRDGTPWSSKFKKALKPALIGAAIGSTPGLLQGYNRSSNTRPNKADGTKGSAEVGFLRSMFSTMEDMEENSPSFRLHNLTKKSDFTGVNPFTGADFGSSKVVHVDNFNRVIWDDVNTGIVRPQNAMLISGALEAASTQNNNRTFVTPVQIAGSLINAGVGYATAGVIGKTLGAMGIMSPQQQESLRNLGTWGGLLNGVGAAMTR